MKRAPIILLCGLFLCSYTSDTITLKKEKVEQAKVILNTIYQYIERSNLPHQEVLEMEKGINIVFTNLGDTVITIKVPKDTTKKK